MPGSSKASSAKKKKRTPAATRTRKTRAAPPRVSLTKEVSLGLFAASQYLDSKVEKHLKLQIPFDVILQDPLVLKTNPDLATDDKFYVKWEPGLIDGPTSARFAVVDYNGDTGRVLPPATWDADRRRFVKGRKVLGTGDIDLPQFHQVNVWAMLQNALAFYEGGSGLGRPIPWGFEGNRLTVVPHAGEGENAFYDRQSKSLQFYYFGPDGDRVHTCLSADIVHHELAHAILDGVRPYYSESSSVETGAFHEFMGDISAVLLSLNNTRFRQTIAEQTGGNLRAAKNLSSIAEQFGKKTNGRDYLRTARSRATMSVVAGLTSVHTVSQVLTATMFDILLALTGKYLKNEQKSFKDGTSDRKPSAKRVFANAVKRMQRTVIQPLDLLPPVDVTFRDYALAVLRAEQLANPLDPQDYCGMMLKIFVKRGILDAEDQKELTEDRYLYQPERLRVFHDVDDISRSRAAAYRFLHDNREQLYIPLGTDFVVADLYDANKYTRAGIRLPRQIILCYVWREDVELDESRFGRFKGQVTTLLCGGTLVFDDQGNVLSWERKPGTAIQADERRLGWPERKDSKIKRAWYAELAAGEKRRKALADGLATRIARGHIGLTAENRMGMIGSHVPPLTAEANGGVVQFMLSPHLKVADDDPDDDSGERQWQISS